MAFSSLVHGGKNVTYRTIESRNILIVGDLWALWGTEDRDAFLPQPCYQPGRASAGRNSLPRNVS